MCCVEIAIEAGLLGFSFILVKTAFQEVPYYVSPVVILTPHSVIVLRPFSTCIELVLWHPLGTFSAISGSIITDISENSSFIALLSASNFIRLMIDRPRNFFIIALYSLSRNLIQLVAQLSPYHILAPLVFSESSCKFL